MPYTQVTLSTLQARLAEKYESGAFWGAEEARLAINEALRIYNMMTGTFRTTVTVATTPGDEFVPLPGTMTYRTRVSIANRALDYSSLGDMDNGRPNWRAESTTTGGAVPPAPTVWIPAGVTLLLIWPKDTAGGTVLTVDGVTTTPILVNPGDTVDIGQEDVGPLLGYALHVLIFKEGGLRFRATMKYYKDFIEACAEKNSRIRKSNLWKTVQGYDLNRSTNPLE